MTLLEACNAFLEGQRAQLWAHFSIADPEDRAKAAEWLAAQITDVLILKADPTLSYNDLGLVGGR